MECVRRSVCNQKIWSASVPRGWLFGQDTIQDRPIRRNCYHNMWYSKGEYSIVNGEYLVFVYRMYESDGCYDRYRCEYIGRWEPARKSRTARKILQFMKTHKLKNPLQDEADFSYLGIRTTRWN